VYPHLRVCCGWGVCVWVSTPAHACSCILTPPSGTTRPFCCSSRTWGRGWATGSPRPRASPTLVGPARSLCGVTHLRPPRTTTPKHAALSSYMPVSVRPPPSAIHRTSYCWHGRKCVCAVGNGWWRAGGHHACAPHSLGVLRYLQAYVMGPQQRTLQRMPSPGVGSLRRAHNTHTAHRSHRAVAAFALNAGHACVYCTLRWGEQGCSVSAGALLAMEPPSRRAEGRVCV
jgi:hypothetical protein